MENYIHYFETNTAFQDAYNGEDYHEPWVSLVDENEEIKYNKESVEPMEPAM